MTIAHLSDTHIGFRQFSRTTDGGLNRREADVMNTFRRCLNAIAEREPDLVVHSGDFFDRVRPTNVNIVYAYRALVEFQQERNARPFVLVAGNHETPRTADVGNILELFEGIPGLHVFASPDPGTLRREIPELDLEVLGVPSSVLERRGEGAVAMEPERGRKHALLALHGLERQVLPDRADFDLTETRSERWTYVAMGDWHSFKAYGENCCYAGSTDYASTDIWSEIATPKGWVWFDTAVGKPELVPTNPRRAIDLPPIDATGMSGEQITEAALSQADWEDDDLPMVRQKVFNVRPESSREIDHRALQGLRVRCLEYVFRPFLATSAAAAGLSGRQVATLEDAWRHHVRDADLRPDVDRERIEKIGEEKLKEATDEADLAEA